MIIPIVLGEPILLPLLILLGTIWLIPHTPLPARIHSQVTSQYAQLPKVRIDLHPQQTIANRYPTNKTALYIEPRNSISHLTPLLVHMMEIVPPEWRFVFLGTEDTARIARTSGTVRRYEDWGKLRVGTLDPWTAAWGRRWDDLKVDEMSSRLLTNSSFYGKELPGVEHLFVFHSDAILCANSAIDLNEWLQYDWVGAPWNNGARFGGNGGLSLRRVSRTLEVLQFQKRLDDSVSEDVWLAARIGLLPGANMAASELEKEFAVEDVWQERPMGYHPNPNGLGGDVWDDRDRRRMIFEYCPEIKIILDMRLERERCQGPPVEALPEEGMMEEELMDGWEMKGKTRIGDEEEIDALKILADHAKEATPEDLIGSDVTNIAKGTLQEGPRVPPSEGAPVGLVVLSVDSEKGEDTDPEPTHDSLVSSEFRADEVVVTRSPVDVENDGPHD